MEFITEPKKISSVTSWDELDSDMSSSNKGNPARKSMEDVIENFKPFKEKIMFKFLYNNFTSFF